MKMPKNRSSHTCLAVQQGTHCFRIKSAMDDLKVSVSTDLDTISLTFCTFAAEKCSAIG